MVRNHFLLNKILSFADARQFEEKPKSKTSVSSSPPSTLSPQTSSQSITGMCYHREESWFRDTLTPSRNARSGAGDALMVSLRGRLADTEVRLERARAREAELSRRLEEMKRFVSVMEILENYLKRRYREQQELVYRLLSPPGPS
ncbi:hypothetical protein Ancab_026223 [Ancistrocladus abbreviatus]